MPEREVVSWSRQHGKMKIVETHNDNTVTLRWDSPGADISEDLVRTLQRILRDGLHPRPYDPQPWPRVADSESDVIERINARLRGERAGRHRVEDPARIADDPLRPCGRPLGRR